jgi:hypothetical protein
MTSGELRQFAGSGKLVTDDNAYFLPINAETPELIQIIQTAAVQAKH